MRSAFRPTIHPPKAVLITPPVYDFAFFDLFSKPYGLLRIGDALGEAGYEVVHVNALSTDDPVSIERLGRPVRRKNGTGHVFRTPVRWPDGDSPVERQYARYGIEKDAFAAAIRGAVTGDAPTGADERPADVVCIGTGMTYWYPGVAEAVRTVRDLVPDIPIIAGGIYSTLLPDHCRRICGVDHAVVGSSWQEINRVFHGCGLPEPVAPTTQQAMWNDPVWKDSAVIRIHTGCPNRCEYCAAHAIHPKFVPGSAGEAFSTLLRIHKMHGTRNFAFYDDALLAPTTDGIDTFLSLVIESGRSFGFYLPNAIHARYLTPARCEQMKRAGFQEVRIGYESHADSFHEEFGSKYEHGTVSDGVRVLLDAGFAPSTITLYILAGLPGQDPNEVEQSIRYASSLGTRIEIAEFSPVPGSALFDRCVRESQYPVDVDPIYQNNTVFPMRSSRFTPDALSALKALVVETRSRPEARR